MKAMTASVVQCQQCGQKNRVPAAAKGVPRCSTCKRALPWIAAARDETFRAVAEEPTVPVLVDLWAPWCGPCRMVSPVVQNLARRYAGRVKLVKVNVDEAPRISERFGVQGIPTLLVLRHGNVVARQTGAAPETALAAWLDEALATSG